jgi:hypothetical protein
MKYVNCLLCPWIRLAEIFRAVENRPPAKPEGKVIFPL